MNMHYAVRQAGTPLALIISGFLLAGCNAATSQPTPAMPVAPPQAYTEPEQRYENPGSLYSDSAASTMLFADNRARNVGDIVLVKIVETAKAKNKADTTAERKAENSVGVSAAFGRSKILNGAIGAAPMLGTTTNTKNEATGETKRESTVTATIGARVMQVLPNGVMQVAGAREIKVNEDTQYMVVTGLVRSSDVAADNTVLSTQMADSKIDYYGKGALADKQRTGWMTRLVDNLWPF